MTKFLKVFAVVASLIAVASSAYAQSGINDIISSAPRWQRLPVIFVSSVKTAAAAGYATDTQAPVTANHTAGTLSGFSAATWSDTTVAIDVTNSYMRSIAATSAFDTSCVFNWLRFSIDSPMKNATYTDPDSFDVIMQTSPDAKTWTTCDSLTYFMKDNRYKSWSAATAIGDTTRFIIGVNDGVLGIPSNTMFIDNMHPRTTSYGNATTQWALLPGAKYVRFVVVRDKSEFPYTTQPSANRYTLSVWLYSNPPYFSQHMNATVR
jgi:hypothetical protein